MSIENVLVLFGGVSTEHMVSRRSAYYIVEGLRKAGLTVYTTGITQQGEWLSYTGPANKIPDGSWEEIARTNRQAHTRTLCPDSVQSWIEDVCGVKPDVVFPAVHGINCEDGALQGLLQLSGIPYVGCGVLASAAGMDKRLSKAIFAQAGIPQCRYMTAARTEIAQDLPGLTDRIGQQIGFPCFLKPNQGGSSVGTRKVEQAAELGDALQEVAKFDRTVLIEEFVRAREIEASVLGNECPEVATIGEIATVDPGAYYDYQTKYFSDNGAQVHLPANLTNEQENQIRSYAIRAYKALDCSGLSRVDFFLRLDDDAIFINEINTLPGFTPISIFPKALAYSGYPIERLVRKLCELAVEQHRQNRRQECV